MYNCSNMEESYEGYSIALDKCRTRNSYKYPLLLYYELLILYNGAARTIAIVVKCDRGRNTIVIVIVKYLNRINHINKRCWSSVVSCIHKYKHTYKHIHTITNILTKHIYKTKQTTQKANYNDQCSNIVS